MLPRMVPSNRIAWTVALLVAIAAPAHALTLTRYPWVALQTPTSMLIAWQTDVPAPGKVLYAANPFLGWDEAAEGPPDRLDHSVTLSGLAPETNYFYRIISGTDTLTAGADYFHTAPATTTPFRFLAFGDIGARTTAQFDVAARIDTLNADFALLTGDIIYDAGEAQNFTPQYFDVYRKTIRRIPFYPSLGNHDEYTANGQAYLDAFYLPSNNPAGTERYYSFDYANAHFVALEVIAEGVAPSAPMLAWLDQDLATTDKEWKFVYFHVPMYSNAGVHGGDAVIAAALEPIFQSRGVDVVLQGHNHFYTRTYPISGGGAVDTDQEPDYVNPSAPIYIVTGGGGRSLYAVTTPWLPYEAFSKSTYHATVVDVNAHTLSLEAVESDGTVMDVMTITKDISTAVEVSPFEAKGDADGVHVRWRASGALGDASFHVYRAGSPGGAAERLTQAAPLTGGPEFEYVDRSAEPGVTYAYRLGILENGVETLSGWVEGARGGPYRFALGRPRPNPARGEAEIPFTLARRSRVILRIVDLQGRLVREIDGASLGAGPNALRWDGRDARGSAAASGIYFAIVHAGGDEARTRITLLR
jgi:3',5'-cyclic AMP phosphodiesterase CpdA